MLEVSQPLSMRLMAPNDVVGAAKIPSAHPTAGLLAADVPCAGSQCQIRMMDRHCFVGCGYKFRPSLSRIRLREASKMMLANRPPALDPRLGTRAEAPREQA